MYIISKERIIDKKSEAKEVIIKRGDETIFAKSYQDSYDKSFINNQNNNIRKGI